MGPWWGDISPLLVRHHCQQPRESVKEPRATVLANVPDGSSPKLSFHHDRDEEAIPLEHNKQRELYAGRVVIRCTSFCLLCPSPLSRCFCFSPKYPSSTGVCCVYIRASSVGSFLPHSQRNRHVTSVCFFYIRYQHTIEQWMVQASLAEIKSRRQNIIRKSTFLGVASERWRIGICLPLSGRVPSLKDCGCLPRAVKSTPGRLARYKMHKMYWMCEK